MQQKTEYGGMDRLIVGKEQGLTISNTNSSLIKMPTKNILLKDILHVPKIRKNLPTIALSTSNNNNFIVEFNSYFVSVKD